MDKKTMWRRLARSNSHMFAEEIKIIVNNLKEEREIKIYYMEVKRRRKRGIS